MKRAFLCDNTEVFSYEDIEGFYADYRAEEFENGELPEYILTLPEYINEATGKNGSLREIDIRDISADSIAENIEFLFYGLEELREFDPGELADAMRAGDVELVDEMLYPLEDEIDCSYAQWEIVTRAYDYTRGRALYA